MAEKKKTKVASLTIHCSLFILHCLFVSCQPKIIEDRIGAVYYESWVFVGRGSDKTPIVAALSIRKTQKSKHKVEVESKLFMSKERQTRLVFQDKKTQDGNARELPNTDPILLRETPCDQQSCLLAQISRSFLLEIQSDPLPKLTPHSWHDSRIGDAITTATLSLNQVKTPGCLFVERGVALTKVPDPFFGDFDWWALLDDKEQCWIVTDGSLVGGFALSKDGASSTKIERQGEKLFLDSNSGQRVPAAWSVRIPEFKWEASLEAISGHLGFGQKLPSGKKAFYGEGAISGRIQVNGESRQCIGWVQHIQDQ
jgi:hypothetical protein